MRQVETITEVDSRCVVPIKGDGTQELTRSIVEESKLMPYNREGGLPVDAGPLPEGAADTVHVHSARLIATGVDLQLRWSDGWDV